MTESKRKSLGLTNIALEGSQGTSDMAVSGEEAVPIVEGPETVVVTTSAPEAMFASWARIAAIAGKAEEVEVQSTQESYGKPINNKSWF